MLVVFLTAGLLFPKISLYSSLIITEILWFPWGEWGENRPALPDSRSSPCCVWLWAVLVCIRVYCLQPCTRVECPGVAWGNPAVAHGLRSVHSTGLTICRPRVVSFWWVSLKDGRVLPRRITLSGRVVTDEVFELLVDWVVQKLALALPVHLELEDTLPFQFLDQFLGDGVEMSLEVI